MKEATISYAVSNDQKFFSSLFDEYYSFLGHIAFSFLQDFDEAEEVVQDCFIKLWEKRNDLQHRSDLKSYLAQMIRNRCLNHLQHEKIKLKHSEYVNYTNDRTGHDTNDLLIGKELDFKIKEVIDSLPPKCKKIFEMSRFEGLKYKQIAVELGISEKTIEQQISKALKRLRANLVDYLSLMYLGIIEMSVYEAYFISSEFYT